MLREFTRACGKFPKAKENPGESKSRGSDPGVKTELYSPGIWGLFGEIEDEAGGVLRK